MSASPSSKQILKDAATKHNLVFDKKLTKDLIGLINYARHIGYAEGFEDGRDATETRLGY